MNNSGLVDLVQITNPEDLGSGLPPSTSEDAGKILRVNSSGVPGWGEDAMATVDQNYDSTSTNPQSGTAVAGAIATVNQVPSSTSADENKVLTVNAQGTTEWANTQLPEEKSLTSTNSTINITEGASTVSIDVTNPLPSSLGTAGQILSVNSGATGVEWTNPPSVTLSSLNTAGITDIQQVASLPASPIATVLYLIPST